jgi:hypothetical protein
MVAFWWNKYQSSGPIVEQATHLCTPPLLTLIIGDLSRYIAGDISLDSIHAVAVEHDTPAGHLSACPVNESAIPPEERIPRVTSALWYYLYLPSELMQEIHFGGRG